MAPRWLRQAPHAAPRLARRPNLPESRNALGLRPGAAGLAADPPSAAQLQRALTLLETLERQGRLAPADQPKIPALRELLAGLSAGA